MKTTLYSLLAAAACGMAFGQTAYTTPVGYVTQTLSPNKSTLISVTVQNPTDAAGVIDAESAAPNTVTDTQVNFTTILTVGATYILEFPDGLIQEVTSWSGSVLTTPDDITASVVPGTTTYKLRRATTVSDIFGANNSFGLKADGAAPADNDLILIPNAQNAFDTVYYFDDGETVGWFDFQDNMADNKVINYADGIFVQRQNQGTDISLVINGEVKTESTKNTLFSGFNFLGAVAPLGLELSNSGLENSLTIATSGEEVPDADKVLQQQPNGSYRTAYYFDDGETVGWFDAQDNTADDMVLDTGFLIENKGAPKGYTLSVPASYNNP